MSNDSFDIDDLFVDDGQPESSKGPLTRGKKAAAKGKGKGRAVSGDTTEKAEKTPVDKKKVSSEELSALAGAKIAALRCDECMKQNTVCFFRPEHGKAITKRSNSARWKCCRCMGSKGTCSFSKFAS